MALILALNPGNSHSPTLSRLARELKGVELIGADSCPTAIKAIKERVPDVVLLPAKQARGEADLLAHLKTIPGGVLTLKLPPVDKADPVDLARRIREMLTGSPDAAAPGPAPKHEAVRAEAQASPQLIAAATATINWILRRQAQWAQAGATLESAAAHAPHAADAPHEPYEPYEPYEPHEPKYYEPIPLSDEPEELHEPHEPDELEEPAAPSLMSRAAGAAAGVGGSLVSWLPRIAALAVVIGIAAALMSYWPQIRGTVSSTVDRLDRPSEPATSPAPAAKPTEPQAVATPEPEPDPLEKVSGWVAVFAPFDIVISESGRGVQVDDRGRAMLAPGRHRLRFQNKEFGYDETRAVDVKPADTTTVNLTPETTIAVTSNEPAEVSIDGTRVGETPYNGRIGLGTHTVTVRSAGAERQISVEATSKPVQLEVDFSKP